MSVQLHVIARESYRESEQELVRFLLDSILTIVEEFHWNINVTTTSLI